jgi:hypothetical protein
MPFSELAARYEALPPLNPPRWRNLHGAMEEARRRDDRRMQQIRNDQRNGQEDQLQLQQDEAEEERQRFDQQNNDDDDIYVDEPVWDPAPPHLAPQRGRVHAHLPPVSFFLFFLCLIS